MRLSNRLSDVYDSIKHPDFEEISISLKKVDEFISKLQTVDLFKISVEGHSEENRPIHSISFGSGKTKLFFWTQMHGNETTATRAMIDWFNYLTLLYKKQYESVEWILEFFSIKVLLVVNPDGAILNTRENSLGIDVNRDAQSLQSKESKVLMDVFEKFNPDFAFNLHDQRNFYHVQGSKSPATISFLAPAFNESRSTNKVRLRAMSLIAHLQKFLMKNDLSQGAALYNDEFYPTSFGDNFQKLGASTILIESGAAKDDLNRQQARRLNALLYCEILEAIKENTFTKFTRGDYNQIPSNGERMLDLILRNVKYQGKIVDIGIAYSTYHFKSRNFKSHIEKIGDLQNYYGLVELNAKKGEFQFSGDSNLKSVLNKEASFTLSNGIEISNGFLKSNG